MDYQLERKREREREKCYYYQMITKRDRDRDECNVIEREMILERIQIDL